MSYAKHDTVLILNPDVTVTEGALEKLYEVLHGSEDIGLVAPKLLNTDGSLQYSCQ